MASEKERSRIAPVSVGSVPALVVELVSIDIHPQLFLFGERATFRKLDSLIYLLFNIRIYARSYLVL